jgi:hypothetical protein
MGDDMIRTRRHARGYTLLETIIAMTVLTAGMLGMIQLQIFGLASDEAARARTLASKAASDLAAGLQRLPFADPAVAPHVVGAAAPALFGALLDGSGSLTSGTYRTWTDGTVPGVRTDVELAAGPEAQYRLERRWVVWEYVPVGGTPGTVRIISVSVIYHEPGRPHPKEIVLYTEKHDPGPLLLNQII